MSTRSRIAIQSKSGKYKSVYHHYDGYPEGVGVSLNKYFPNYASAVELVSGGDISFIDWDSGKVSYYATRGEWNDPRGGSNEAWKDVKPQTSKSFEDLIQTANNTMGCYLYVYYYNSDKPVCYDLLKDKTVEVSIPKSRKAVA
tara:strand:+ start:29 stop:457 length:429 start_codon:yes stop_codon:yes gene_type:complete